MTAHVMDRRGSEPIIEQSTILLDPNYGQDMLTRLNAFRAHSAFTDTILCIEQEEFPCHRNVLAVSSPYFQAMFTCDLREKREQKITLNQVSPWIMKRIIEYAYSGKLEITVENAQELLAAASLFEYPKVVQACCDFLLKQIHCSNCLGIEAFAQIHSCSKLSEEARKFAIENFSSVIRQDEFLDLSFDRVLFYISSDLIDVRTEEDVFEAVAEWANYDLDNRRDKFVKLLEHVRLRTVKLEYLDNVANNTLVNSSEKCLAMVEDARTFHESKRSGAACNRRRSLESLPRPSTVAKEVMVVVGGRNSSCEMYESHKNKWTYLPESSIGNVTGYSITSHFNDIFVTGGIMEGRILDTVRKFDSSKKLWVDNPKMLMPRAQHGSASLGNKLYVVGGISYQEHIFIVERIDCFDNATQQWTCAGHCPFPRKMASLIPYNSSLFELGGMQGDIKVPTIECYDQLSDGTIRYSGEQFVLPEPIQHSLLVLLNGVLYIIWANSKKVISFNATKRTLRCLPDLNHVHLNGAAAVIGGKIYVSGGFAAENRPSRVVEVLDPVTLTWSTCKSMKQARAGHGAVTLRL